MRRNVAIHTVMTLLLLIPSAASAEIVTTFALGGPLPDELGGYEMLHFPDDERPQFQFVSSIEDPFGEDLVFSDEVLHMGAGEDWVYLGEGPLDVYNSFFVNEVSFELPAGTRAFYLRALHEYQWLTIEVDVDGVSMQHTLDGVLTQGPAALFGFHTSEPSDPDLHTVTISAPSNFVFGELAIGVPEPGTAGLLSGPALVLLRRR